MPKTEESINDIMDRHEPFLTLCATLNRANDAVQAIENDRLRTIAAESLANYAALWAESADDIQDAIKLANEEADEETGKMPVGETGHSLAIDLNKDGLVDTLTVSLRHKREAVSRLPDPSQPELPMAAR